MKSLEEFVKEIKANEALKQEFTTSFKEGSVDEFLKKNDCDATAEDVKSYLTGFKAGALSDDDLDKVAGGGCSSFTCAITCGCG